MNKKRYILIIILFMVCIGLFGTTYALYQTRRIGTENLKQIAGDIYMHYSGSEEVALSNAIPSSNYQEGKYFEFTVDGKNTNTKYDIWYEIVLEHGNVPNGKTESNRLDDKYLKFRLVELDNNNEVEIFTNRSYSDLTNKRIYVNTILKNTTTEIVHTYRLYMWIGDNVLVGNVEEANFTPTEWANIFASIKIKVTGDFTEKELTIDDLCFEREESNNNIIITGYDRYCGTVVPIPSTLDNKNVTEIKEGAFSNSLLTNVEIPNTITKIEKNSFNDNNITSVTIPNTVTYLSCYAFDKDVTITKDNNLVCQNDETNLTKIMAYNSELDTGIKFYQVNGTTNGNGLYLRSGTENDDYPIYFYRGNIDNNNIIFANFCWKIVRTTETGGTKLIYNGTPTTVDDHRECLATTGADTMLSGNTNFASSSGSPARVGYSNGTLYNYSSESYTRADTITYSSTSKNYYFSDGVSYASSKYTLTGTPEKVSQVDSSLVGKWTIQNSSSATGTGTYAYYVYAVSGTTYYMYRFQSGDTNITNKENEKIYIGTSVTPNGTNFNVGNTTEVYKKNWYSAYSNYVSSGATKYYYCSDGTTSCSEPYYITATSATNTTYTNIKTKNYKYSKSFRYENGNYVLNDTEEVGGEPVTVSKTFYDWKNNYNTLSNAHYTCLNESGTCTSIKYIYYTDNSLAYYITISNGKSVEDALNEMLKDNSNVAANESTIATKINTWYDTYIKPTSTNGNIDYQGYLEDTEWCNDRSVSESNLGGWKANGGSTSKEMYFDVEKRMGNKNENDGPKLTCDNEADRLSVARGKLKNPIALLTADEVALAGGVWNTSNLNYYLYNNTYYWLLSPSSFNNYGALVMSVTSSGDMNYYHVGHTNGARPAVSLKLGTVIASGNGERSSPYIVE